MPDKTKTTISATEMPALFNASPYTTRWMLWQRFARGQEIEKTADNRMDWGKRLQPLLLDAAAQDLRFDRGDGIERDVKVTANPIVDGADLYMRRGLLGCTRDGDVYCPDRGPGVIETKAVFDYRVWMEKWGGGATPPREYEIQLQQQMYVGDGEKPFEWGVLSAWVGGEMFYFERRPIPELWDSFQVEAATFFEQVRCGIEPPAFGAVQEVPLMTKLFSPKAMTVLDYRESADATEWAQKVAMMDWHATERLGHEKGEKAIKAELVALMGPGGYEKALFPHGINTTMKKQSRKGYVVKPTEFFVVSCYVPDDVPRGGLEPFEGKEIPIG